MKVENQYIIPFKGLKEGQHNFEFDLGSKFFEENTALGISSGNLKALVLFSKNSGFLQLAVNVQGSVELVCDRCLESFNFPIQYQGKLHVKFKEDVEEPDDEIIFLQPNEDQLDLNQYFYDCIGLSLPIQKFHPGDENGIPSCNPEVLKLLDYYSQTKKSEEIDPRWSKLSDLMKDRNKSD